jgi:hypothetical protein
MAHYALLDENTVVTQVITGLDETELIDGLDPETWYGNFHNQVCKRTSYNTYGGESLRKDGMAFRKNYAGIGYTYDESRDAFIPPKSFDSFILDEDTCLWKPPVDKPTDGKVYTWDEPSLSWKEESLD